MKQKGFDLLEDKNNILKYQNDGTKHRNKDYNKLYPEPKGKVVLYVNFDYTDSPFVEIRQDGDTRTVYHGICETEMFLDLLLDSIR